MMYILTSILLSFIYTSQIFCAASSSTRALSPKIHRIFNNCTSNCADRRFLHDLLRDDTLYHLGRMYIEMLHQHEPYQTLMTAIEQERDKDARKDLWRQLDREVYLFLGNPEHETDALHQKGKVITVALFQQEWLSRDPASFDSIFHHSLAGSKSSKRATSASSSTARVPKSSSKRHMLRERR